MDHLDSFYKIKNGYTNLTERVSFSVEVHKCYVNNPKDICKSPTEIEEVMSMIFFTNYNV